MNITIHRADRMPLSELAHIKTSDIALEDAAEMIRRLGEHGYSYENTFYWYGVARIEQNGVDYAGVDQTPFILATRPDGTAFIKYEQSALGEMVITKTRRAVAKYVEDNACPIMILAA